MLSLVSISSNLIAERIITHVMCGKESWDASSSIEEVKQNVMPLNLPHILEENIKELVEPMSYEVEYYYFYIIKCGVEYNPSFVQKLIFTMDGKIDYKLSARQLVLDENLDIKSRVILACKFCCEEEILAIWRSQPALLGKLAEQEELTTLNIWLNYFETGEPTEKFVWKDCVLLETAFFTSVDDNNLEAAKYFLKKMVSMSNKKKQTILESARASIESAHSSRIMTLFTGRLYLFLGYALIEVNNLIIEHLMLKKKMLTKKHKVLMNEYKKLLNQKKILTKKSKVLMNEHKKLLNQKKMLTKKRKVLMNEE